MMGKLHGVLSLFLVGIAKVIVIYLLWQQSFWLAIIYLGLLMVGGWVVIQLYCTKCCCYKTCQHVLPGLLVRVLGAKKPGPYHVLEMSGLLVVMLLWFSFPQYWLWQHTTWFVIYWVLVLFALIEIMSCVCKTCGNHFCPMHKKV